MFYVYKNCRRMHTVICCIKCQTSNALKFLYALPYSIFPTFSSAVDFYSTCFCSCVASNY